ncbi:hypothetical protein EIL87_26115 [Saccharopolyspora rhizosphaerae]|uniref:MFS transporter n=1 Tax=Saccharopolyspora rhizosphaerae TaxID=2492662 RepID=A0A3R8Q4U1_9PSEU|nr:hypothetical protein EIL87_26115 [Saccharopolyspora rhizosphaerae]
MFVLTPLWSASLPTAVVAAAAYGLIGFGVSAPQTSRILRLGAQPSLSVALSGAVLYLAIALSGESGGAAIAEFGPGSIGLLAGAGLILALVLSEIAHRSRSEPHS